MRQEKSTMAQKDSARRRNRRYLLLVLAVAVLIGGWSAFWFYAADQAQKAIAGWRAREALAGRVYSCGEQSLRGFPFRIEVDCAPASAAFKSGGTPFKAETARVLVAAQIYQPGLLISEVQGPLTFREAGKQPSLIANWRLAQTSVAGTPTAPERVALVFDKPVVARMDGDRRVDLLRAEHVEIHGRLVGGAVWDKPVIEMALSMKQASLPQLRAGCRRAGRRRDRGDAERS